MKKNIKYLLLAVLFTVCTLLQTQSFAQRTPADSLLNFMNANKPRASIYLIKNDDPVIALNATKLMPLAQITNVLIAVEFAQQATNGAFDENSYVLVCYVFPLTISHFLAVHQNSVRFVHTFCAGKTDIGQVNFGARSRCQNLLQIQIHFQHLYTYNSKTKKCNIIH